MGSKRYMLRNGLGYLLNDQIATASRFVDLFCGAGSVASFCSQTSDVNVLAIDIQQYATTLTRSVLCRNCVIDSEALYGSWRQEADRLLQTRNHIYKQATELDDDYTDILSAVTKARDLCSANPNDGLVFELYGGYYYSPSQALVFDAFIDACPSDEPSRSVCMASIIMAASKCAAAPGHTAQPFSPTMTAGKYIVEAWRKSPFSLIERALQEICSQHARITGHVYTADAFEVALHLNEDDLVFVDPPYSGVQYSRFYHVLETMARGYCSGVSGAGRYPPLSERPQSVFSNKSSSLGALHQLLGTLANNRCRVIFTFPEGKCSNGLSGDDVREFASKHFIIKEEVVTGRFSTLGGNNGTRSARQTSRELLLLMTPK